MESTSLTSDLVNATLLQHYPYYQKLKQEDKDIFVKRLLEFAAEKDFTPMEGVETTTPPETIMTLISASAIQVTFGLKKYLLEHFSRIIIYPTPYFNRMTQHWHKGEASVMGTLVFSWKDLVSGIENQTDKLNLGLHEMAHALMLSRKLSPSSDIFFNIYFDKWWSVSNNEFQKLEKHQTSFFRDYGGTNSEEFFAVCVECFFEAPKDFKELHPEIYRQTCILLNQDPSGSFDEITGAREKLFSAIPVVEPNMLLFNTTGWRWGGALRFALLLYCINGVMVYMLQQWELLEWGTGFFALLVIIRYLIPNKQFYFYENSFVVQYERAGATGGSQTVLSPEQIISVCRKDKSSTESLLQITYIDGQKMRTRFWSLEHLRKTDREAFWQNMTGFCEKHKLTVLDPEKNG
jgi:Mlc titration factor MtfA (ptsG expression regulator)